MLFFVVVILGKAFQIGSEPNCSGSCLICTMCLWNRNDFEKKKKYWTKGYMVNMVTDSIFPSEQYHLHVLVH